MTSPDSLLTPESRARVLSLLRGVLAEPSGSPDDSWHRVVFCARAGGPVGPEPPVPGLAAWSAGSDGGAPGTLVLGAGAQTASDEAFRAAVSDCLTSGARQVSGVRLPGGRSYDVRREPAAPAAPLAGKIALVTGAAGAIGAGLCRGLLARGARVAAADRAADRLSDLVRELEPEAPGRCLGTVMDVTEAASVAAGFDAAAGAWGGVDLVVVNAGLAAVAELTALELETFRRLERVNVDGTLLTLAEAGRRLRRQGTGGDIVLVSTKNVFAPGAQFGAYSATKAAAHQLARIASLELAPFDIRVNMVSPDAVFGSGRRRSGLWAEVGPARMLARGLDERGLEEYYRTRNLLKARVTPEHVANAVLFFATRQTPTTGATLPVDGGLPDATPR